jgi:DHA3 family macrolide efflux protein-like MFS transporter
MLFLYPRVEHSKVHDMNGLPAQYVLLSSGIILLIAVIYMLRPSIMKQAHPELEDKKIVEVPVKVVPS